MALCVAIALGQAATAAGQTAHAKKDGPFWVVPVDRWSMPYDANSPRSNGTPAIEFRNARDLSAADRDLVQRARTAIERQAEIQGFDLNRGHWGYRQIVSSAFRGELVLWFERDEGPGDRSLFTAAIARGEKGKVEVIPILRRGYSPYKRAAESPLTIAVFNRLRAHGSEDQRQEWTSVCLAYAALAGARVQLAQGGGAELQQNLTNDRLTVEADLDRTFMAYFVDQESPHHPLRWTMTFDSEGRLLKVTFVPAAVGDWKPVP